jgi:hypothetical protein
LLGTKGYVVVVVVVVVVIALAGTCGKRMHVICRSSPVHLPCILFFSNVEH